MKRIILVASALVIIGVAYWLTSSFYDEKSFFDESMVEKEDEVLENFLITNLFEEVDVGGALQSLDSQENVKMFGGIEFTLNPTPQPVIVGEETLLTFGLKINGRPASDMQTQSGVYGKGVAVHKESLEIIPIEIVRRVTPHGTLEFRAVFPQAGEYAIFTQFKRSGSFITTAFLISVI